MWRFLASYTLERAIDGDPSAVYYGIGAAAAGLGIISL